MLWRREIRSLRAGSLACAVARALPLALCFTCLACHVDDRRVVVEELATGGAGGTPPGQGSEGGSGGAGPAGFSAAGSGGALTAIDAGGGAPGDELSQRPTKLDLLLMIDNSSSMSDKQELLRLTVPDLLSRLVNPVCIDDAGNEFAPPPPGGSCPANQERQFEPFTDVHVGIVSSSLGDWGANAACPVQGFPRYRPDRVDMAHLAGSLPRISAETNEQGFLEWRAGSTDLDRFTLNVQNVVGQLGENGCGWEASLESWYRFLVDPVPYRELTRVVCPGSTSMTADCTGPTTDAAGTVVLDQELLAQRAAFLRDDSLVAIMMLSDENDCSAQAGGRDWLPFVIDDATPMFRGSSACEADPNAMCCYSCSGAPPAGCAVDPACTADAENIDRLQPALDGQNLRCFDQKRRFGHDSLYPTQRYVNALTQRVLCTSAADLAAPDCPAEALRPNPLFEKGRSPAHVFLAGIIGVPWQTLSTPRDIRGEPLQRDDVLRFRSYVELTREGVWAEILGDPGVPWRAASGAQPEVAGSPRSAPRLPQMVESEQFPRPGVTPGNPLNGRDYDTTQGTGDSPLADDLQYACIFPLSVPRDCSLLDPNFDNCDCYNGANDRPLCEETPGASSPGSVQYWGKAYPGSRELAVLRDYGAQTGNSVVASICARNTTDPARADFGYRPAVAALFERVQAQLKPP